MRFSILIIILFLFSCKREEKKIFHATNNNIQKKDSNILTKTYKFDSFSTPIYNGKLASPVFKNNPYGKDLSYVEFLTEGCKKNKINFAGHYTILEKSCGAMCTHIFIIDRKDGTIYTPSILSEGKYGYKYQSNSTLLIANSELFIDQDFNKYESLSNDKPEFYQWNNNNFLLLN